jgi:hypothetical protein
VEGKEGWNEFLPSRCTPGHFRQKVHLTSIRLGNVAIDDEVEGKGWKTALEIKTHGDNITRGIGQLAEALVCGYNQVVLVTTLRTVKRIDLAVFDKLCLVLVGIDSKGNVEQVYASYASSNPV